MRRLLTIFAMLFFTFGLARASYDLNRVLEELQHREKTMSAVSFNFRQEIKFVQLPNKTVVSGEALFGSDGKMRITKQKPDEQLTVSDGKKIWVFNPAYRQVWEGSAKNWLQSQSLPKGMVPLNNYIEDLQQNFNLRLAEKSADDANVRIIAEPKNAQLGYKIELIVATDTWLPVQTIYTSESADVVTFLSKHQVNPPVADSAFKFSAPKGTEVIPFN